MEQYVKPELLVFIPILNAIGFTIKKAGFNPRFIPILLVAIGAILASLYMIFFSSEETLLQNIFTGIMQGSLLAITATGMHQNYKQIKNQDIKNE